MGDAKKKDLMVHHMDMLQEIIVLVTMVMQI